jgi:hypothetical protein
MTLAVARVSAETESPASRFFAEQKEYTETLYALNDYVEFSVFDMSKLNLFINSKKVELRPLAEPTAELNAGERQETPAPAPEPRTESQAEREIKAIFPDIPKFFYKQLKAGLWKNKVPVTLYATNSPAYAKPIQLYVKLKKISLAPSYTGKKGESVQPVGIKIYGQLKDKNDGKILMRFYDVQTAEFSLGQNGAGPAFDAMAAKMMDNLAAYMKTKY